eukprot:5144933-Pyramimonas_sp.AAC.1
MIATSIPAAFTWILKFGLRAIPTDQSGPQRPRPLPRGGLLSSRVVARRSRGPGGGPAGGRRWRNASRRAP